MTHDLVVLAPHSDYGQATYNLQQAVNKITQWTAKLKIQINGLKSARVNFTLRHIIQHFSTVNLFTVHTTLSSRNTS